jgi:hypothetical protein
MAEQAVSVAEDTNQDVAPEAVRDLNQILTELIESRRTIPEVSAAVSAFNERAKQLRAAISNSPLDDTHREKYRALLSEAEAFLEQRRAVEAGIGPRYRDALVRSNRSIFDKGSRVNRQQIVATYRALSAQGSAAMQVQREADAAFDEAVALRRLLPTGSAAAIEAEVGVDPLAQLQPFRVAPTDVASEFSDLLFRTLEDNADIAPIPIEFLMPVLKTPDWSPPAEREELTRRQEAVIARMNEWAGK